MYTNLCMWRVAWGKVSNGGEAQWVGIAEKGGKDMAFKQGERGKAASPAEPPGRFSEPLQCATWAAVVVQACMDSVHSNAKGMVKAFRVWCMELRSRRAAARGGMGEGQVGERGEDETRRDEGGRGRIGVGIPAHQNPN
jgi:hypothetical protein